MRPIALLGLLLLSRWLSFGPGALPMSLWTPIAFLWPDIAVVIAYALIDRLLRPPALAWTLYGVLVAYIAINVPVARVLSSPLSWSMLGATGGTLADSISHHVTVPSVLCLIAVLAAAVVLPVGSRWLADRTPRPGAGSRRVLIALLVVGGLVVIALGPLATARIDTRGRHRNALSILVETAFARLPSDRHHSGRDWRRSPVDTAASSPPPAAPTHLRGAAAGRNVVLIVLESAGARYLGLHGAADDPMPNLSRLAGEAIVVEDAYTVYPESVKGLMALLCSRYPALDTRAADYDDVTTPALATVLSRSGYRTALFHSGRFGYLGMSSIIRGRGFERLEDAGDIGGDHESSFGVEEDATVSRILEWVDSLEGGEPFFVTYLPIAGHHPYETPGAGPFPDVEERGRYLNALHYADRALGDLTGGLEARGLLAATLLVVVGDHGQAFGQHEGNYGHSLFLYEENVRVPLLFALPGLLDDPIRVDGVSSVIDAGPTTLDLLGIATPAAYQGETLLEPRHRLAPFFADYSLGLLGLRDGPWKCIHTLDTGRTELYDLREDPLERRDLAARLSGRAAAYADHLRAWASAQRGRIVSAD